MENVSGLRKETSQRCTSQSHFVLTQSIKLEMMLSDCPELSMSKLQKQRDRECRFMQM